MKYTFLTAVLLCVPALLLAQGVEVSWEKDVIDGHRTGVVASNASNVEESMGSVSGRKYLAPNGRIFRGGTVRNVARIMLEAQPAMAGVKQVIGYSTEEMIRKSPECSLYDWFVDELMRATADSTGKKIDIGLTNRGGVRTEMPKGEIFYDDIMSMFPFKNNLCYVAMKGRDVKAPKEVDNNTRFIIMNYFREMSKQGKEVDSEIEGRVVVK